MPRKRQYQDLYVYINGLRVGLLTRYRSIFSGMRMIKNRCIKGSF